jgi:succinyl-CoA synthetase beta subunit
MRIHEYQAKRILAGFGVRIPRGGVVETAAAARAMAEQVGPRVVVKAQIHAGGRGKGGGIGFAATPAEAEALASKMIGLTLVTHQTGPEGKRVKHILVEEALEIGRELYIGIVIDPAREAVVVMASPEGGVEIEKVAAEKPGLIFKEYVDQATGLLGFQARKLAFKLGLEGEAFKQGLISMTGLVRAFKATDASLAEINPLVVTKQGDVLALDAKMAFDDNALGRHPDIRAMRDLDEESPLEVEASKHNLNYIKLDGNIGCMVNGAGLAMATMDIIKYYGGAPANFLDVGGATSVERVKEAFKILLADPDVKVVFVNIFGGIVRTDLVANGIVYAVKGMDLKIPVVVRLVGTNEEEGQRILRESGLNFVAENLLPDAVLRAVELARTGGA